MHLNVKAYKVSCDIASAEGSKFGCKISASMIVYITFHKTENGKRKTENGKRKTENGIILKILNLLQIQILELFASSLFDMIDMLLYGTTPFFSIGNTFIHSSRGVEMIRGLSLCLFLALPLHGVAFCCNSLESAGGLQGMLRRQEFCNRIKLKSSSGMDKEKNSMANYFRKHWGSIPIDSQDDLKTVSASFLTAIFIRAVLVEPRYIPTLSMYPTFDAGDLLLVDKFTHEVRPYSRKDVVVFNPSENYIGMTGNTDALIKRIVALSGDTVEIKGRVLFVNGIAQAEPYINELTDYTLTSQVVPAGMMMMLGDNRNHSFDSHNWGYLPTKNVIGRAFMRYWPPSRVGFIEGSD